MRRDSRNVVRLAVCCVALCKVFCCATSALAASSEAETFFLNEVKPLLALRCISCHGPDKTEGGLRLDSREAALKGGDSGPALVVGKPEKSLLVMAIKRTH